MDDLLCELPEPVGDRVVEWDEDAVADRPVGDDEIDRLGDLIVFVWLCVDELDMDGGLRDNEKVQDGDGDEVQDHRFPMEEPEKVIRDRLYESEMDSVKDSEADLDDELTIELLIIDVEPDRVAEAVCEDERELVSVVMPSTLTNVETTTITSDKMHRDETAAALIDAINNILSCLQMSPRRL